MVPLIFILISLVLLAGFSALTVYEARRGVRFYAAGRSRFDAFISHAAFILTHADFALFIKNELKDLGTRIGHDIAHLSLLTVRAAERLLTRLVRRLRPAQDIDITPRETSREFVKTLSDFKDNLKATHPEISDIQ